MSYVITETDLTIIAFYVIILSISLKGGELNWQSFGKAGKRRREYCHLVTALHRPSANLVRNWLQRDLLIASFLL